MKERREGKETDFVASRSGRRSGSTAAFLFLLCFFFVPSSLVPERCETLNYWFPRTRSTLFEFASCAELAAAVSAVASAAAVRVTFSVLFFVH